MHHAEAMLLLIGGLVVLLAIAAPVGIAFLAVNLVGAVLLLGREAGLQQLARNFVFSTSNFALTPIPLFIAMGEVLFHTGVAFKAIYAAEQMIQRVPGRLAVVAVVAGTIFSAISGSTVATTALLGSLLLPQMLERGYEPKTAIGPILAIGGVDMLIPPSALTVLFGSLANISISDLLIGTTAPGLLMSLVFVGYIIVRATFNPKLCPIAEEEGAPRGGWARFTPFIVNVLPLIMIFVVVVGSMVAGIATPTESAALGAAATIATCAMYRSLSFRVLIQALQGTAAISGAVLFIIACAMTFSQILAFSGATSAAIEFILGTNLSATVVLLLMLLIVLVLGKFVEPASLMLITLPFYMPLVRTLRIEPIWFGVLYLICTQFGLLTPPFGMLLFTLKSVAPPEITYGQVVVAALPYLALMSFVLLVVWFWPPVVTWLPALTKG
jgi:tripartite ATP-independent transporter DctM subunit